MDIKLALKKTKYLLPSSTVLMLHNVSAGEIANSITLSKAHLEQLLRAFGCFADIADVLKAPEKKRIALSFDDGYEDLFTVAYPMLKAYGVPFTAFIAPSFLDTPGYLTTAQLCTLAADPLVTIGSHNLTHRSLKELDAAAQTEELLRSKEQLETLLGRPVSLLAYPNGQANDVTFSVLERSNAYQYAFLAAGGGISALNRRKYAMPRLRMDEKVWPVSIAQLAFVYGAGGEKTWIG